MPVSVSGKKDDLIDYGVYSTAFLPTSPSASAAYGTPEVALGTSHGTAGMVTATGGGSGSSVDHGTAGHVSITFGPSKAVFTTTMSGVTSTDPSGTGQHATSSNCDHGSAGVGSSTSGLTTAAPTLRIG